MFETREELNRNRELRFVMYLFVAAFFAVTAAFCIYVAFNSRKAINSSYNMRQANLEKKVIRGMIFSSKGDILAEEALNKENVEVRYYPYKELFAHAVGFSTHGRSGAEYEANIALLTSNAPVRERLEKEMSGIRNYGDNVYTTYDLDLQKTAYDALGVYKGAVIVTEVKTGRILAMVSKPDFDPNTVSENWAEISADTDNSPLLNRALQGLYPPGSTFKIVTLLEYIKEYPDSYEDFRFTCNGSFICGNSRINCYHNSVHGKLYLRDAFEKSCNSAFADIGTLLNLDRFHETAEELLFNEELPFNVPYKKGSFVLSSASGEEEILQSAIGQGNTLMSPAHINMITCAIANDGILMKPYQIEKVENYRGSPVQSYEPREYKRLMSEKQAETVKEFMIGVVKNGTGKKLKDLEYEVAGKTGSAEFGKVKGNSHSWFTGFSDPYDPDIAVTVLMEGAGSGSDYAVPVAKRIFDAYYAQQ